jgi:hypothetical protein
MRVTRQQMHMLKDTLTHDQVHVNEWMVWGMVHRMVG